MGFFRLLGKESASKVVVLGLDNSGKSTILSFLQDGKFTPHVPTMGKQKKDLQIGNTRISLFDMGGQKDFRDLWFGEIKQAKVVMFVIDAADQDRFAEAKDALGSVLDGVKKACAKLLVLANKRDLLGAASMPEIISAFDLINVDNFEVLEVSAKTGYGMADAFSKLYSMLTGQQIHKSKMAKAISLFNYGGVPILSQFDRDQDAVETKSIEGGFLMAITCFANMKMCSDETKVITFESAGHGTFIVARSLHYIGSLLWDKSLGVPIEHSKSAVKEMVEHLETVVSNPEDDSSVAFAMQQYVTNLI
jgi:small GTP-binding protein